MEKQIKNEEFDELDFEDQCKIVYNTTPSLRGDLIVRSQDPERLVNSLSPEDFYLMVREMDNIGIPEIIRNARFHQLEFMADFECWDNDVISGKGFIQWLKFLEDAGGERLEMWLLNSDFNMIISGFQKYVTVLKPYHEERVDEVIGDKPYFTLDGLYYIMIEEENMQTVQRAIEILFEKAKHYYYNLLEGIMSEMEAIVEEEAYSRRQIRLGMKGFPTNKDAHRIYKPIEENEWETYSKRANKEGGNRRQAEVLPLYPTLWQEEKLFLDDVLATLVKAPRDAQREIYQEFVWLCNKIITVRGMQNFGEKLVKESFSHLRHMLNIGLEDLSQGDLRKAHEVLVERWAEYIFRWGFTPLLRVRDEGERIIKSYWDFSIQRLFEFLDEPFGPTLGGILKTCPQVYDPKVSGDLYQLRDFKNINEVNLVRSNVSTIENIFKILCTKTFNGWKRFMNGHPIHVQIDSADIKLSTFFLTLFSQFVINKKMSLKPLDIKDLKQFIKISFMGHSDSEEIRSMRPDLKADFIKELRNKINFLSEEDFNSLQKFFEISFKRCEEEFGLMNFRSKLNPNFIHCVLLRIE